MGGISTQWQRYEHSLKTALQDFLLDESLVDVTLITKDKVPIKAHKLVLAANSQYFREVFGPFGTVSEAVVVLPTVAHPELDSLMHYLYSGQLCAKEEQIPALLELADTLQVHGLSQLLLAAQNSLISPITAATPSSQASELNASRNELSSGSMETSTPKRRRRCSPTYTEPPLDPAEISDPDPTEHDLDPAEMKPRLLYESQSEGSNNGARSRVTASTAAYPDTSLEDAEALGSFQYYDGSSDLPDAATEDEEEDDSISYLEESMTEGENLDDSCFDTGVDSNQMMLAAMQHSDSSQNSMSNPVTLHNFRGGADGDVIPLQKLQCGRCLRVFSYSCHYKRHLTTTGCFGRKETYVCSICPHVSHRTDHHRNHLLNVHKLPRDHPYVTETYTVGPRRKKQRLQEAGDVLPPTAAHT